MAALRLHERLGRLEKMIEARLGEGCRLCASWPVLVVRSPDGELSVTAAGEPCEGCGRVPSATIVSTGLAPRRLAPDGRLVDTGIPWGPPASRLAPGRVVVEGDATTGRERGSHPDPWEN